MQDTRAVVTVDAPPEPAMPGSSWIGIVMFPVFAVLGVALGFVFEMPWLITSSLAIGLALLAVVSSTFLNRRARRGTLRLEVADGATRLGPAPSARWIPLAANVLAMVVILTDIGLRLAGYFADEDGLTFSLMIALVVGWGLMDGWYGFKNPPGLKLTPGQLVTVGNMGRETAFPWSQISGPATVKGSRMTIPVGKGEAQVGANQLDSDPRAVAALLDAYRGKPARHSELGDGRVVERARSLSLR